MAFSWDCDGKVYFLNTEKKPWNVVYVDGIFAESAMTEEPGLDYSPVKIWPLEEPDFLSVIERWAGMHGSTSACIGLE